MLDAMEEACVKSPAPMSGRLVSLDALRGFSMFWILGMEELATALRRNVDTPWVQALTLQMKHVKWEGFRFLDLVFPLFVFVVGASLVFSLGKASAARGRAVTLRKLLVRTLVLFALGIVCYGGLAKGIDSIRWLGVLQRIALCYFFAGLAFLFLKPRARGWLAAGLLLGYWALLCFVPVPGIGAGDLAEGRNLANWVDARFLPGFKWDGDHDPEGLLSTLPAIASCLLGVAAGEWLRRTDRSVMRRAGGLIVAGAVMLAAGWLWHWQFPVIKKLWTSSYVLVAAGWSAILLGCFHALVEGCGWRKWAAPFVWIGMNPITLYLSTSVLHYHDLAARLAGGPVAAAFGPFAPAWLAFCSLGLALLLAWFLHSRQIFLRV